MQRQLRSFRDSGVSQRLINTFRQVLSLLACITVTKTSPGDIFKTPRIFWLKYILEPQSDTRSLCGYLSSPRDSSHVHAS